MQTLTSQQVTRIKLDELNRQYHQLHIQYNAIIEKVDTSSELKDKFQFLYDGLCKITFAQKQLHPDVENLSVLQSQLETNTVSDSLLKSWVNRLRNEIEQGKLRLEAGLVFGLALEDTWHTTKSVNQEKKGFEKEFIELINEKVTDFSSENETKLREWITVYSNDLEKIKEKNQKFVDEKLLQPVTKEETAYMLHHMKAHPYHHTKLKAEISSIVNKESLVNELAGTITVLLNNFENWKWTEKGVELNVLWTKHKWRPYMNTDLLESLLLEIIGMRFGRAFRESLLEKDFWGKEAEYNHIKYWQKQLRNEITFKEFPSYINYSQVTFEDSYSGYDGSIINVISNEDTYFKLLQGINAQLEVLKTRQKQLNQAATSYVIQTDLKNYFLTLPHQTLLIVLEELGINQKWLAFFKSYFEVPYLYQNQIHTTQQGISLSHLFSSLLADVLLLFLDKALWTQNGISTYRYMDDMYIFCDSEDDAKTAWQTLQDFYKITGLQLNKEKIGVVRIGNPNPKEAKKESSFIEQISEELNTELQLPNWMFLSLNQEGNWKINQDAVEKFAHTLSKQLNHTSSIFDLCNVYNTHISFLLKSFAIGYPLGKEHIKEINQTVAKFEKQLLDNQESIFEVLKKRLITKFPQMEEAIQNLPEAWYYWSLTAGGFALQNPFCHIVSIAESYKNLIDVPKNNFEGLDKKQIETKLKDVFVFYKNRQLSPVAPKSTPVMQGLMNDFIDRGTEVSGKKQNGLGIYWQWLLYTYGYQLLDSFGTFRFLLTELVPLETIFNRLSPNSESEI
ncbi:reverse transcriptase domain-containing protein [Bernardetia sp. MNP-M8]|uniref:reverse transcriptase domain-containing protein n=1 Tax=Bernardetia sp. MNP-M8 TaxID=3127470 RepID=UPI0030CE0002